MRPLRAFAFQASPIKELKERPDEHSGPLVRLPLITWLFFHEMGIGCACARARVRVCEHCNCIALSCRPPSHSTRMRACACARISGFAASESSKNDSTSIPAFWCLLTLITWPFFHEMGTGCACVRARVRVCGHCRCIALSRRPSSSTQNMLFLL